MTRTFSFVSSVTALSILAIEPTHARSNKHVDDDHGACRRILATRRPKQCMRAMGRTSLSGDGQGGVGAEQGPVAQFDDNLERILRLSRRRRADHVRDLLSGLRRRSQGKRCVFSFRALRAVASNLNAREPRMEPGEAIVAVREVRPFIGAPPNEPK
jgi:hypothetical protein